MNTFVIWAIYFFVVIIAYLLWKIYDKLEKK